MYDDDEDIVDEYVEVEEQPVYEVVDDDEDDVDDDFEEHEDDPYVTKGKNDRSFVDQQAKDYDEEKRKKRVELAKLRQKLQIIKGNISKKERELRDLDIQLEKEDFREMKEGVVQARKDAQAMAAGDEVKEDTGRESTMSTAGIEFTGTDMDEEVLSPAMQKRIEREAKRRKRAELEEEIKKLRLLASKEERVVSQLEYQILRS
jgi:hypothetical protein